MSAPIIKAHWVHSPEGVWYVLDRCAESPIMSAYLQPFVTELVTNIFSYLGRTLVWTEDVEDETGRLA